jgi:hypothetical protein
MVVYNKDIMVRSALTLDKYNFVKRYDADIYLFYIKVKLVIVVVHQGDYMR